MICIEISTICRHTTPTTIITITIVTIITITIVMSIIVIIVEWIVMLSLLLLSPLLYDIQNAKAFIQPTAYMVFVYTVLLL